MGKLIGWLITSSLLLGCAQEQLYLSRFQQPAKNIQRLQQQLQQRGYQVTLTDVAPPERLTAPLLIKSPLLFDDAYIEGIVAVLQQQGYGATEVRSLHTEQHFYNGHNVGVYLPLGNHFVMPSVMQQERCSLPYVVLETNSADDSFSLDIGNGKLFNGHYQVDARGRGVLQLDSGVSNHFQVQRLQVNTWAGERWADRLTIMDMSELLPQNCQLLTVYDSDPL